MGDNKLFTKMSRWAKRFACLQEHGYPIKPMSDETVTCKHCGTVYKGNYCPRCGQSRVVSGMNKRGFVNAFREAYPQLATTFFRTILELLYRPGYMIRDYFRGHRVIYSGPFKTFIVIASVYVLFVTFTSGKVQLPQNNIMQIEMAEKQTGIKANDIPLGTTVKQRAALEKIKRIRQLDDKVSGYEGVGPVWTMIKQKANEQGSLYLFFCVPLLALAAKRAFRRGRFDGRQLLYAEHFMIFTYLYAVNICFSLIFYVPNVLFNGDASDSYPTIIILFYLLWTYKGIYGWRWRETLRRAIPLAAWSALFFGLAIAGVLSVFALLYEMV